MYESPINTMFQNIETRIVQRDEQMIFEAIQKQNVFIDKEELIKAMNYDRNQYSKGYKDGVSEVGKIRAEIESKYESIPDTFHHYETGFKDALEWALSIIDKYKSESEEV